MGIGSHGQYQLALRSRKESRPTAPSDALSRTRNRPSIGPETSQAVESGWLRVAAGAQDPQ
jgi:hypothetical protein